MQGVYDPKHIRVHIVTHHPFFRTVALIQKYEREGCDWNSTKGMYPWHHSLEACVNASSNCSRRQRREHKAPCVHGELVMAAVKSKMECDRPVSDWLRMEDVPASMHLSTNNSWPTFSTIWIACFCGVQGQKICFILFFQQEHNLTH